MESIYLTCSWFRNFHGCIISLQYLNSLIAVSNANRHWITIHSILYQMYGKVAAIEMKVDVRVAKIILEIQPKVLVNEALAGLALLFPSGFGDCCTCLGWCWECKKVLIVPYKSRHIIVSELQVQKQKEYFRFKRLFSHNLRTEFERIFPWWISRL